MYNINILNSNKSTGFDHLPDTVNSDHSSIGTFVEYPGDNGTQFNIMCSNISNPLYHVHFKDNKSFNKTHLVKSINNEHDQEYFKNKISTQMNDIVSKDCDVYIVVEGYQQFFSDIIANTHNKEYELVSRITFDKSFANIDVNKNKNITGILVDRKRVNIVDQGCYIKSYVEGKKNALLAIPWVEIEKNDSRHRIIVCGVHVSGCQSQYPKVGIGLLCEFFEQFDATKKIVAMGDFNTIPYNIMRSLGRLDSTPDKLKKRLSRMMYLTPLYFTHMNPNCSIGVYDHILYSETTSHLNVSQDMSISQLPLSMMDKGSIDFTCSLYSKFGIKYSDSPRLETYDIINEENRNLTLIPISNDARIKQKFINHDIGRIKSRKIHKIIATIDDNISEFDIKVSKNAKKLEITIFVKKQ